MDRHIGIAVPGQAVGVIMRSPHSHSSSPGTRRWTSKPDPVRGKDRHRVLLKVAL
jgi:hypothetical protein